MNIRIFLSFFLALGLGLSSLFAQNAPDFWGRISPDDVVLTGSAERQTEPVEYSAFTLDYQQIRDYLTAAPQEFSPEARQHTFQVVLPTAEGKKVTFAVVKTHIIEAPLEAQHPEIGTYSGTTISGPNMQVRITVTPSLGFQAMITRADKGIEYIEPVAKGQNLYYRSYDRVNLPREISNSQAPMSVESLLPEQELTDESLPRFTPGAPDPGEKLLGSPVSLKVYRLAISCTGEFSQDNGGTQDAVFAKITTITNQLNAIYERDINIRLVLIAESYNIIFLDPDTDPYPPPADVIAWMNLNPTVMLQYLGSPDKYDIGHLFARYPGTGAYGVSGGGYCCTQYKARGASSWQAPYGDPFFAIVSQEIGHQWRSGHTFNQCYVGAQFNVDSDCEPGSGSTIMSYSGLCGTNDVNGHGVGAAFLYYHACSIAEIRRYVEFQEGATCGSNLATTNTAPMASTTYPPVTFIPISTPFVLTGSAVDMDGDPLTYCWDEIDVGAVSCALGSPVGAVPIFRWYEPTNNPTRTFPRIQTVTSNNISITELLPTYNRDITFAFVARDNKPGGGGVGMDTVSLRATTLAGPFLVNYPDATGITWKVGEYQTILWDVANTDKAPVNAKIVNIKLSTNSGIDYPVTLATGVPNNGKYCIQVPNNVGSLIRIRVEAADNVFFDISNNNFTIAQPTAAFSLCATAKDYVCLPSDYTAEVSTAALAGFSNPVTLSASGLPNGATATFSPNPVQPGSTSTMTISFPGNSLENTFDVTVTGNATAASATSVTTLTIVNNDFSAFGPLTPANGAAGVNKRPVLFWNGVADADAYDVELATNPSFDGSVLVTSKQNVLVDSLQVPFDLEEGKVYYWHVRPKNDCGPANWSDVQVFVVAVQSCAVYEANDLPKNITANGTPTVESKITLTSGGAVSDVNVTKIQGTHSFFKDLEVHLIGPAPTNTDVLLWKDKCSGYNGGFNIAMDDGAAGPFSCPPPNNGVAYKPTGFLNSFNGQSAQGVWTLRVKDNVISSGGSLAAFSLQICSNVALNPPKIMINSPLTLNAGTNAVIGDNLLKAEDANNGPASLLFTLMSLPTHGQLLVNGLAVNAGSQFTQADISNGGLRYYDYGLNQGNDAFNFAVTDGEGGLDNGTFLVEPTVGTHEPNGVTSFDLAPNPASSVAVLSLSQPLTSDARVTLINTAGQVIQSWQLATGTYALRMELNNLPKGVYAVSLENSTLKSVKKLVIQ